MSGGRIKGFVFDAFGTVVTPVSRLGPYQRLAVEAGVTDSAEYRRKALTENIPPGKLAKALGRPDLARWADDAVEDDTAGVGLFPDAVAAIETLAAMAVPFVICSNLAYGYGAAVRRLVPTAMACVMSYEVGHIKPEPEIYEAALNTLGMPPDAVFFVGDTPKADLEGPAAFGMSAALVDRKAGRTLNVIVREALRLG